MAGGVRPYHTIMPGMLLRDGKARMSFGVMGGHMQPQGHVQMVLRVALFRQNPQAACDAPRWYLSPEGELGLERELRQAVGGARAPRTSKWGRVREQARVKVVVVSFGTIRTAATEPARHAPFAAPPFHQTRTIPNEPDRVQLWRERPLLGDGVVLRWPGAVPRTGLQRKKDRQEA
jgi:gamma-glutamyltranspeptidase